MYCELAHTRNARFLVFTGKGTDVEREQTHTPPFSRLVDAAGVDARQSIQQRRSQPAHLSLRIFQETAPIEHAA